MQITLRQLLQIAPRSHALSMAAAKVYGRQFDEPGFCFDQAVADRLGQQLLADVDDSVGSWLGLPDTKYQDMDEGAHVLKVLCGALGLDVPAALARPAQF